MQIERPLNRDIFEDLIEGLLALRSDREGKVTLRRHTLPDYSDSEANLRKVNAE
jgi:wyosine [tRNA(Phe)-imidazoG37] synthetase (radical SAM superfamily)